MCGCRGLRDIFGVGVRVRAKRACGKGAVGAQHGTGVKGICIPAQRAITPCKGFFWPLITAHVLAIHIVCCKYASCAIHSFLFCRLKINHMTEIRNMRL